MKNTALSCALLAVFIAIFVGCVVFLTLNFLTEKQTEETLILVHVVARHGQRTPDPRTTYPNDIHRNHTYLPEGRGRLTEKGVQQSYKVGQILRQRYHKFLGPEYYHGLVKATSSGMPRCRATTQAILGALFEGSQLIPEYDYLPLSEDHMISILDSCPDLVRINASVEEHVCKEYEEVIGVLSRNVGLDVTMLGQVTFLYDLFYTQKEIGLALPVWLQEIWPQPFESCAYNSFLAVIDNKKALSYVAGNLIKKIIKDTQKKIKEIGEPKMYLYTGHDMTIAGLLGMFGLYSGEKVHSCEFLVFELHKINDTFGFKVYHENYKKSTPILLDIPFCGTFCPIDQIINMVQIYYPRDWCDLN